MTTLEASPKRAKVTVNAKTDEPPRKRRRRTATAGAAEDCFACQRRHTTCDRKRPYCSQCLEIGNECSGYRTTLTWGVGVASRGKLRGLSLPVVKPGKEYTASVKNETCPTRKTSNTTPEGRTTSINALQASNHTFSFQATAPSPHRRTVSNKSPIKAEDSNGAPSFVDPFAHNQRRDTANDPSYTASVACPAQQNPLHVGLPLLQTTFSFLDNQPIYHSHSAHSSRAYSDASYITPREYPQSASGYLAREPYTPSTFPDPSRATTISVPAPIPPSTSIDGAEQAQSATVGDNFDNRHDTFDTYGPYPDQGQSEFYEDFDLSFQNDLMRVGGPGRSDTTLGMDLVIPRSLFATHFFHLPPRMQSLLDFYDKHICSVLVAFDGQSNPYREHILHLATHSQGLQNAIAALATNNIRMRTHREIQNSGYIEDLAEEDLSDPNKSARAAIPPPTAEELCYKSLSIDQLNIQLTSAASAQDDSVLATLLILCLFHVCDSGFSKFKTQLAGVQKLLSLRGAGAQSGFLGWVQMFFSWFDVMTSTVNDREAQIKGDSLDMLDYSSNLGALEQFSGCDGRLFKLIARLGRLNLLAQGRPVRLEHHERSSHRQRQSHQSQSPRFQTAFDPMECYQLDGNGWGPVMVDSPEEEKDDVLGSLEDVNRSLQHDTRHEFWQEWYDIRSRLQSWSMDTPTIQSPVSPLERPNPGQRDLVHINESFRSSALLYTERLANPHLPSSAANFQDLVCTGLSHITALSVTSCVNKFLLWPLFIIGTECVDSNDRLIVRQRCVEIQQESGFFNNISVLEVLERVWSETTTRKDGSGVDEVEEVRRRRRDSTGEMGRRWGQAFRWRRAMDRVDGEYIVV